MKILVVCQYYYPEPFRITDICESLAERGHEITVLTGLPNYPEGIVLSDYQNGKRRIEVRNGVNIIRCHERGRGKGKINLFLNYLSFAISGYFEVGKIKEKFDVVFVNQLSPVLMTFPSIRYKKKFDVPILLYCLDLWPASLTAGGIKEHSSVYKIMLKISRYLYCQADSIAVTSQTFIDYFESVINVNREKVVYLPQYAETIFEGIEMDGKPESVFDFVFAGNVGEMQSVETIIDAALLLKDRANVRFHIVGDGSSLEKCKKRSHGLNNVHFYGRKPIEDMINFYKMADAMLITLRKDKILSYTLPGKVQSYMAAGKPIIGAADGETQFVIKKAGCGYCCAAENVVGLADQIIEFVEGSNDARKRMAQNSKDYYVKNYAKHNFMAQIEKLLEEVKLG